jgi:hypothetical protein
LTHASTFIQWAHHKLPDTPDTRDAQNPVFWSRSRLLEFFLVPVPVGPGHGWSRSRLVPVPKKIFGPGPGPGPGLGWSHSRLRNFFSGLSHTPVPRLTTFLFPMLPGLTHAKTLRQLDIDAVRMLQRHATLAQSLFASIVMSISSIWFPSGEKIVSRISRDS